MRISVSNIAWELAHEDEVAALLSARGVDLVDVAPGKYFPDPEHASDTEIAAVRKFWADRGFGILGMQSLLFGTQGLNLFDASREIMLSRLSAVCRIGGGLGVRALTFGSPRQRDRSGLGDAEALDIAVSFFRKLGDSAQQAGVLVCLEPNPSAYNCNFMVNTREALAVVRACDHPAIRLQLDTGAIAMNDEPVTETVAEAASWIGHVHASEPKLAVLDNAALHAEVARALRAARPELGVTIEMAPDTQLAPMEQVARALDVAQSAYGD